MIAIVESGSTKSDWRIVAHNGATQSVITAGFNPYITGGALIVQELQGNALLKGIADQLKAIYFYGAGCSTQK
jgi:glucosamine kinase